MLKNLKQKAPPRKRVSLDSAEPELFEQAMARKSRKVEVALETLGLAEWEEQGAAKPETPGLGTAKPETPGLGPGLRYLSALLHQKQLRDAERRRAQISIQRKQGDGLVVFESDSYKAMGDRNGDSRELSAVASAPQAPPRPSEATSSGDPFSSKIAALDILRARERYFTRVNKRGMQ